MAELKGCRMAEKSSLKEDETKDQAGDSTENSPIRSQAATVVSPSQKAMRLYRSELLVLGQ